MVLREYLIFYRHSAGLKNFQSASYHRFEKESHYKFEPNSKRIRSQDAIFLEFLAMMLICRGPFAVGCKIYPELGGLLEIIITKGLQNSDMLSWNLNQTCIERGSQFY